GMPPLLDVDSVGVTPGGRASRHVSCRQPGRTCGTYTCQPPSMGPDKFPSEPQVGAPEALLRDGRVRDRVIRSVRQGKPGEGGSDALKAETFRRNSAGSQSRPVKAGPPTGSESWVVRGRPRLASGDSERAGRAIEPRK